MPPIGAVHHRNPDGTPSYSSRTYEVAKWPIVGRVWTISFTALEPGAGPPPGNPEGFRITMAENDTGQLLCRQYLKLRPTWRHVYQAFIDTIVARRGRPMQVLVAHRLHYAYTQLAEFATVVGILPILGEWHQAATSAGNAGTHPLGELDGTPVHCTCRDCHTGPQPWVRPEPTEEAEAEAEAEDQRGEIEIGSHVIVEGVRSKPELNGCYGRVLKHFSEKDRYGVLLLTVSHIPSDECEWKEISLKREVLAVLADDAIEFDEHDIPWRRESEVRPMVVDGPMTA